MELLAVNLQSVSLSDSASGSDNDNEEQIRILIDGQELICTKKLLVKHSKYFKAFLAFSDTDNGKVLELKGGCIDYDSVRTILDGLVRDHIQIDEENVQDILQASAFLQCASSEKASADFMLANLNLSNAFSVFILAVNCGSGYLAEAAEAFILSKITSLRFTLTSVMDLFQMDLDSMTDTLELIDNNEVAFSIACGWVLYDLDERASHLQDLLKDVITEIILPESLAVDGLEDHPVIVDALAKSVYYEALPLRGKVKYWESMDHRSLAKWPKSGIVCSTGNNASAIAYRCPSSEIWLRLTGKPAKLRVKSSGSAVVICDNALFFIGGVGNIQMWSFGLRLDSWKCLAPEQDERIRPLACGVGNNVYIFGGYTDRHKEVRYFDTAVRFDTLSNKWHLLSPMSYSRSGGQACYAQGKIYLFGGLCSRRRVVVSCEVYDIATDQYDHLTDLPAMILDFGLVLVGDLIYLIGGMDPLTFETKDTVFVYDLKKQQWCQNEFPSLKVARLVIRFFTIRSQFHLYSFVKNV